MSYCPDECHHGHDNEDISVSLFEVRLQRARKEHDCASCDWPIAIGRRYWRYFGLVDNVPMIVKTHFKCDHWFNDYLNTVEVRTSNDYQQA